MIVLALVDVPEREDDKRQAENLFRLFLNGLNTMKMKNIKTKITAVIKAKANKLKIFLPTE